MYDYALPSKTKLLLTDLAPITLDNYYSKFNFKCNSLSCSSSICAGASIMTSRPLLFFRESDKITNGLLSAQNGDQAIQPKGDTTVWGRSILKSIH